MELTYVGLGMVSLALAFMFGKSLEAMSRNSSISGTIMTTTMIAAAFIELLALFILAVFLMSK